MGVPHLFQDDLKRFVIPLPPLQEQKQIVSSIDTQLSKVNTLLEKSGRAIKILQERRSALITAAVTGQIDVTTYYSNKHPIEVPA